MESALRMSELVVAARFYSREEAQAFYELAHESGARVHLLEPELVGRGFDITLGAAERVVASSVMIHPDDWESLETALEPQLEIDPHDPVAASPTAELRALLAGPRDANLPERVIARKVIAALPPASQAETPAAHVEDIHRDGDEKVGVWLTSLAMLATLCFVTVMLTLFRPWGADHLYAYGLTPGGGAEGIQADAKIYGVDPFAAPIKGLLPLILPSITTLSVILTRRRLKDGRVRPMFPRAQRQVCWFALGLSVAVYLFCFSLAVYEYYRMVHIQRDFEVNL